MSKRSSLSWLLPFLYFFGPILFAQAKSTDMSLYPLRVQIFESQFLPGGGAFGSGRGRGNVIDGQEIHGIDFTYYCLINYATTQGTAAYPARWKKVGKTIELVGSKSEGKPGQTDLCDFKIKLLDKIYAFENGTLLAYTNEQFKARSAAVVPVKRFAFDPNPASYPIGMSVLSINWDVPQSGMSTGTGKGNVRTATGLSSVDFTSVCDYEFHNVNLGHYYYARWAQEGTALAILITESGQPRASCMLLTTIRSGIYWREASGEVRSLSPAEYREAALALAAARAAGATSKVPAKTMPAETERVPVPDAPPGPPLTIGTTPHR